jgi:hypothetical protein
MAGGGTNNGTKYAQTFYFFLNNSTWSPKPGLNFARSVIRATLLLGDIK